MTKDKQNTPFPPEDRRTEYVSAKVTPGQKQHIRRLAEKCGMTVSNYIRSEEHTSELSHCG